MSDVSLSLFLKILKLIISVISSVFGDSDDEISIGGKKPNGISKPLK